MSRPAGARARRRRSLGLLLVLASAACVAVVPTAARIALDAGGDAHAVVTLRGVVGLGLMASAAAMLGQSLWIPRAAVRPCIQAGLAYAVMSLGLIGAIAHLPVSLAILVYFTHPLLLAVLAHWQGREPITTKAMLLGLVVLVGLALAIGPSLERVDTAGILLAALAAIAVTAMIERCARAQQHATSLQLNIWMSAVSVVACAGVTTIGSAWSLPSGIFGWAGLVAAGAGVAVGLLAFFTAVRLIGAVHATMLSNAEPLLGILLAVAVLGERLAAPQWAGVVVVLGGLVTLGARVRQN